MAEDPQFRAAEPIPAVGVAKIQAHLSLAQIVETVMEAYADRPALGQRVRHIVTDPTSGRRRMQLGAKFETMTYRDLWSKARALANSLHRDPAAPIGAGDLICILGFAGCGYVIVDLATISLGAVTIPLQTNASTAQLRDIVMEVEPQCIATSLESLDVAVQVALSAQRATRLVVFDYDTEDYEQSQRYENARQRLASAGSLVRIDSLDALCKHGSELPPAPIWSSDAAADSLSTIYYTSGTTGSAKGAMYPQKMVKGPWIWVKDLPCITLNYMPMNHAFGRSTVASALGSGGTCYFTARSDLSTLFDDIRAVRPTQLGLVPRLCEMIFHVFQAELERRSGPNGDCASIRSAVMQHVRDSQLGGRILAANSASAPMTSELKTFIEACLDIQIIDAYGATEVSGVTMNSQIMRPPVIAYKLIDVPELGYFRTDKPYPRGELLVKTHSVMQGYFKRPELSAAMFDEEGYYKTGDIMAEIGPDRVTYLDRRNNVVKLAQGEFVAVAKLEAIYASGHPILRQVYIYGTAERSFLVAVVVLQGDYVAQLRNAGDATDLGTLIREAFNIISKREQMKSYEVPREFLIEEVPFSMENGLLTGVGKFKRPALKARYGERLEQLYMDMARQQTEKLAELRRDSRSASVLDTVLRGVQATLGIDSTGLGATRNFGDLGGDSLSALSFSLLMEETFEVEVPVGVIINPASNLEHLAHFIERARDSTSRRPTFASVHGRGTTDVHARELTLDKFIDASTLARAKLLPPPGPGTNTVLLTGATGYLGRFICLEWLVQMSKCGGKVVCIVRGHDAGAARRRLFEAFETGDTALAAHFSSLAANHLEVLPGDIGEPSLGVNAECWNRLADTVDLIVHPAALVNHILPYGQLFGPNVVGTAELIRLAITSRIKRFHNVSTVAAAMLPGGGRLDEDADVRIAHPMRKVDADAYANGYAVSKWAGEVLLRDAHERIGLPVSVFRSDMILGHTQYRGQINLPDMFTRWIYSLVVTGLAPRSFYADAPGTRMQPHYDGLPVDFTAEAIRVLGQQEGAGFHTYHVVNPHDDGVSLDQFVDWMIEAGISIRRVEDYQEWLGRFETALRALPDEKRQQSSLMLLHQLREPSRPSGGALVSSKKFHDRVRELAVGPDRDIPHLSKTLIQKYLEDLRHFELI
jgi:fatty acid CoA ligase FadD9